LIFTNWCGKTQTFTMVWYANGVVRFCHCFSNVTKPRWPHTYLQHNRQHGLLKVTSLVTRQCSVSSTWFSFGRYFCSLGISFNSQNWCTSTVLCRLITGQIYYAKKLHTKQKKRAVFVWF